MEGKDWEENLYIEQGEGENLYMEQEEEEKLEDNNDEDADENEDDYDDDDDEEDDDEDDDDEDDDDDDDDDEDDDDEEDDDEDEDDDDDDDDDEDDDEDEDDDDDEDDDEDDDDDDYDDDDDDDEDDDDEDDEQEFVFYEESGGVTKERATEIIQGLSFSPDAPMGVVGGSDDYGIASFPGFVLIFFNGDSDHPMQIMKRAFMPLQGIMQNVGFYMEQGDFQSAAACVIEAIKKNADSGENWEIYCTAGEIFWKLREMELASNMFMEAYQCRDCDQKAHVLCQAAATYCIMQKPDVGFALYHKALQEEPESLEVLHDLGGFHWDMGELDEAAKYYFSVLKKNPAYYASYEELSNLFGQLGNTVWPQPFMDCFKQERALSPEKLAAAEADMLALLEKQK